MNSLFTIDGPITRGPAPRWQKQSKENQTQEINESSISINDLSKSLSSVNLSFAKTPSKKINNGKKTPKAKSGTPTPNKPKTPGGGDRFIPVRSASNYELGSYKMLQREKVDSPKNQEFHQVFCENVYGTDLNKQRILSYQVKAPMPPNGFQNPLKIIYTQAKTPATTRNTNRYIPQAPDRILDAPDIVDDYYLNLIDWNPSNILAAALGQYVYLWDAGSGKIEQLLELEGTDYVCSVAWIQEGDYLAVGTTTGSVQLWDCSQIKRLRIMEGHSARVGSLAWNSYILSSGSRSGQIIHHDVRQREHLVNILNGHTQEVCGLKWSTDGKYLASGGNDNAINIWQAVNGGNHTQPQSLYTFTAHQAAVKALAWCPWQPHILASGGGTADRYIRFWNCNSGACVNAVDTKSQVCALLWSTNYKEIVSGHGFANNQLIIWKYPGMTKVTELTGHTARVLHLALSPDGSTVLSAGADETLRLWKCFVKNTTKTKENSQVKTKFSALKQSIR